MISALLPVEARVLSEMICNPDALALCDSVETSDFVDMRHEVVLSGIRQVQEWEGPMCVDSVIEAIEYIAMQRMAPEIAEKVDAGFIADMLNGAPKPDDLNTIRKDVVRLRKARDFRESLWARKATP